MKRMGFPGWLWKGRCSMSSIQHAMREESRKDRDRRGVALIVVLGFLSLMVMMAVAFLTQARVERMVSSASLEGMRTRQMAQSAIAAGMQDYLNALKNVSQAETVHDVFLSGDGKSTLQYYYSGQILGNDRLVIGKVEDWLSDKHLAAARGEGEPTDAVRNAEWIWVRQQPGTRSRILGRYAYACFDMSGLLDANLLGTAYGDSVPQYGDSTNRNNVRKMVFEALNGEKGGETQRKLHRHQANWRGFDTPAALLNLIDGKVNDGDDDNSYNRWSGVNIDEKTVGGVAVDALAPYSYSVLHLGTGNAEKIRCTPAQIDAKGGGDFTAVLAGGNRTEVLKALADYVSSDVLPGGVDYPSVKNVPMFNEIAVQAGLIGTPAGTGTNGLPARTYNLILKMKIEFWYPFPSRDNASAHTFTMTLPTVGGDNKSAGDKDVWVRMAGGENGAASIVLSAGTATPVPAGGLQVSAKFNGGKPYFADNATGGELVYTMPLAKANGDTLLPDAMTLYVRNVQITKPLVLALGGPADSTPTGKALDIPIDFSVPIASGGFTEWQSVAVDDPRLNHQFGSWMVEASTPGDINQATQSAIAQVAGETPGQYFYCRNEPMRSPVELGYLCNGTPWKTLNIFSDEGTWLMNRLVCDLDVFDVLASHKAFFTNGTINPYTRNTNVLNAAFYGVDIREVPGMSATAEDSDRMTGGNLKELVKAMMAEEAKKGHAGWGTILDNKNLMPDLNKNNRIALMGNTWGLFNESDRLFVVVVTAQSIKEGEDPGGVGNWNSNDDMISGERRAVALCWLDGSAEGSAETLTQEMNIIMFQYLND